MSDSAPGDDAAAGGVSTELAALERSVGTPAYWRNEGGIQDRYRELVTARQTHTAAPPAQSSAAAKEIAAIERTMRTDAAAYWKSPELQERYRSLIAAREAAAAPPGNDVIGTQRATPPAKVAKERDAHRELLAENDRKLFPPPAEWRLAPDAARATLPPQLVAEWDETGDYAARVTKAQDGIELIARTIGDPELVANMQDSFRGLPAGARAAVMRELGGASPGYVAVATPGELKAFRDEMPLAPEIEKRWGKETARRVGIACERVIRTLAGAAGEDKARLQAWWDRAPPLERASIFFAFGSLN